MAMAVASHDSRYIKHEDLVEASRHLSHTFRLVNEKLSGHEALSDTTMAAVIALTQHERMRNQYQQGMVHFKGLLRIVELLGGISGLARSKPRIAQKVFR